MDDNNPLLERLKFLAILGSNMEEFFMVRVSGIRKQVAVLVELKARFDEESNIGWLKL